MGKGQPQQAVLGLGLGRGQPRGPIRALIAGARRVVGAESLRKLHVCELHLPKQWRATAIQGMDRAL